MRCEITVVNPTEVVSADGAQRYPKGTFGIRYNKIRCNQAGVDRLCGVHIGFTVGYSRVFSAVIYQT